VNREPAASDRPDPRPLIAVIDDDPEILQMLHRALTFAGYRTVLWQRGKDAHRMIRQAQPALVILDLWLEARDSGEIVLDLLQLDPRTRSIPVIVCSGHVPILRAMAHAAGAGVCGARQTLQSGCAVRGGHRLA